MFEILRDARDTEFPVRGAMIAMGRATSWKQKTDATQTPAGFAFHAMTGLRRRNAISE
jgi:hypothetical protein